MPSTATKGSTEYTLRTGFVAGAIVLLLAIASASLIGSNFIDSAREARRALEMASTYDQLRAALGEFTESHYGWMGSRDSSYLQQRTNAAESLESLDRVLLQRTEMVDPALLESTRALTAALHEHVATLTDIVPEVRDTNWAARQTRTAELRSQIVALQAAAHALANRNLAITRAQIFWVYASVAIAAIATLLVLGFLLQRIRSDLRRRQTVESNLRATNRLLESLLDNMPAMVFAKEAGDLRLVRFNRTGEDLLGVRREDILGKLDTDLFPPQQAAHFIAKDREALALGTVVEIPEEEIQSATRGTRVLHTLKVPIAAEDGTPLQLLGISLDITEQKVAERRIVALNEELIHQAQLLQSSNQELESFCYSVSHDLRAPLRAINGYARLLEQELGPRLDPQGLRYLHTICAACARMSHLIDDLLEFSRLGRQSLQLEAVDMMSVVTTVVGESVAGREGPPPVIATHPLPSVQGDRNLLRLVWLNLIDNAVKYSSGVAAPQIDIGAEEAGDEVVYSVADNGIGFDMQYADKLFGVFQRLHSDTKYPGTGVGLAIVHRIVARHGGRVWANSRPGDGATFRFAMPRLQRGT